MTFPLQITFRDMEASPALEEEVRNSAERLEREFDRIERAQVVIERPHQHQRRGQQVHVRIVLAVPGSEIVVSHEHGDETTHADAYLAVRDAFRTARRRVHDFACKEDVLHPH